MEWGKCSLLGGSLIADLGPAVVGSIYSIWTHIYLSHEHRNSTALNLGVQTEYISDNFFACLQCELIL